MSEAKMRVQADELAKIVAAFRDDGEHYRFDRIQNGYRDKDLRAVFITDVEGEPVGVRLRDDVDPLLDFVQRLARDLAEAREREALVLSVKAQWTDSAAAERVAPQQAETYLRRTGWEQREESEQGFGWVRKADVVGVPARPERPGYGRRMSDLIRTLADVEQRSPLAVWLDLLAEKP